MAALGLVVLITHSLGLWLLSPLVAAVTWLFNLPAMPWLLGAAVAWLLAGRPPTRS